MLLLKLIEAIEKEMEKAQTELERASLGVNYEEFNFWQGQYIGLAKCLNWCKKLIKSEDEK
jgi:hypothetical protein